MKNLNLKSASAINFLPFGPEGIKIEFAKYGKIVLVRGENRDAKPIDPSLPSEETRISSNGSGKSSVPDIITWGFFGKTIKRPEKIKKDDVIHNKIGKDCEVEIIWDKYRLLRTRNKNSKNTLQLWQSEDQSWNKDTEISMGSMDETQKKIETLIGLSYDAFVNIVIFTDNQSSCFLESDGPEKREIVENLLSLGIIREWHKQANEFKKELNSKIKNFGKEYDIFIGNVDAAEKRLKLTEQKLQQWRVAKQAEYQEINLNIEATKKLLHTMDNGPAILAYQTAQEEIVKHTAQITELEAVQSERQKKISLAKEKESLLQEQAAALKANSDDLLTQMREYVNDKKSKETKISAYRNHRDGEICDTCAGLVLEENCEVAIRNLQLEISKIDTKLLALKANSEELATKVAEFKAQQQKIKTLIQQGEAKYSQANTELSQLRRSIVAASQVKEPKADSNEVLLQERIENLKKQAHDKLEEVSGETPFDAILLNDQQELEKSKIVRDEKSAEIKALEFKLPYYDYWLEGFGDRGIRKWVVDGIIPELNSRIAYWLQFLIDNTISLKFNSQLEELIERNPADGDPYIYHAMSAGQRRRLNLAVSQAFAHIMMINCGAIPSFVFLDEVTTNIDPLGVQGIFNMICELAEDKQVFLTTHDPDLVRMVQGCDIINLVHENGFTKIAS